jgi:two-component system, cell cycle sensor histidine kinase and response regulator CckA
MAIIREHSGDISAQPLPDGGSVFTVSLPVCTQTVALAEPIPAQPSGAEAPAPVAPQLAGKRILVVDDEEGIRELVADSLTVHSIPVDCAASPEEALELAFRHSYDAILCDLNLESESGLAVSGFDVHDRICEGLASRSAAQPLFIFMTGDLVDSAANERAGRLGSRFLQKPFRIADLLALLSESISPATVLQPKVPTS